MARSAFTDHLQVYPFWLLDIAPIEPLGLPVLTPLFGFASITAPEITVATTEIEEGNWYFSTAVLQSASVGSITLTRGATVNDSDFWRWMRATLAGDTEAFAGRSYGTGLALGAAGGNNPLNGSPPFPGADTLIPGSIGAAYDVIVGTTDFNLPRVGGSTFRRDLLLIQFFARGPLNGAPASLIGGAGLAGVGVDYSDASGAFSAGGLGAASFVEGAVRGFQDGGETVPRDGRTTPFFRLPAKAWMLRGCIPIRYKSGSDFDASSGEVSIQELEVAVDIVDEISLSN